MLPSYIIIKILNITNEYEKYAFLAFPRRVRMHIKEVLRTELFKWQLIIRIDGGKRFVLGMMRAANLDTIKFIRNHYQVLITYNHLHDLETIQYLVENKCCIDIDQYLTSDNMKIVLYAFRNGADEFPLCAYSNNLEVVKLIPDPYLRWCNKTTNPEIARYVLEKQCADPNKFLRSNSMEVVQCAISYGATDFTQCASSENLDVFKLSPKFNYQDYMGSHKLDVFKFGYENGGDPSLIVPKNMEIVKFLESVGRIDYKKLLESYDPEVILYGLKFNN